MIRSFCLFCILWLGCTAANAEKQQPFHFVAAYDQAQKARQEADNKLSNNMKRLEDWLARFKNEHNHLPEQGSEQDDAIIELEAYLNPNPYSQTGIMASRERRACPLRFITDLTLDRKKFGQWENAVPDNWVADPGSLTIISNTIDFFLIWGAGADHQPLRSPETKKYRLVFHDCRAEI